jgi:hypothetical protein
MEHVQTETTPELVFRPASEHDYPAIAALVKSPQELFRVYPRGSYPLTVEQLRTLAAARRELTVVTLDGQWRALPICTISHLQRAHSSAMSSSTQRCAARGSAGR